MADDDEWQKLPTEDKVNHKVWKARVAGYEEATTRFRMIDNEKSDEYGKYVGSLKKFVTDSNAVAQEKGLEATLSFVQNAAVAGRVCGDVVAGIVLKVLNARAKSKQLGFDICLMYIELEKQDVVMEELLKGFDHKQPKIVAACIALVCQALSEFGSKVISLKPVVKSLTKLFNHSDKTVREEVKLLSIEIYRWIRDAIKTPLQGIKPVQMKELEEEWSKLDPSPAIPTRFTKSEQAKQAAAPPPVAASAASAADGAPAVAAAVTVTVDPYDLLDPVEILSQLPGDFFDKVAEKKWQDRKEALEALDKLTSNPKIEPGQYGEVMGVLKKVISKDSNVMVVALGAKCVNGLAKGLRKKFNAYAPMITHVIFEKFKEKKLNVVLALRDAIDAVYLTTSFPNMMEDIQAALANKNPNVKEETCKFLARTFSASTPATLSKAVLKPLSATLISKMDDTVGLVRDAAADALGTALKVVGERLMLPYIEQLDKIKQDKVRECAERAEINSNGGGGATGAAPAAAPSQPGPSAAAPAAKPGAGPAKGKKTKPSSATTAPEKQGPPKAKKGAAKTDKKGGKGKGKKKKGGSPYELDQEEPDEPDMSEGMVEDKGLEIFGETLVAQMSSSNWKERLAAVEEMTKVVETLSGDKMPSQVLVRTLAKKPGWKETNFQVLKGKFVMLAMIAKRSSFTRRSALYAISGLILKISDVKLKDQVKETLKVFAENISLNYVSLKVAKTADESKNPKLHTEALNWMNEALKEFGFKIDLKPHITFIKASLQHTNPAVRGAAIQFLATIYLYVGANLRMFFEDEKPALLQQIDTEFEKAKDQTPPAPVRRVIDDEEDEAEESEEDESKESEGGGSGGGGAVDLSDLVDRVDISEKLTETLLVKLSDKNWKIRKEGLEEVTQILTEAKFIKPNLGELPPQLKTRLADNNKVLVTMTLNICKLLAEEAGPSIGKHKETLIPGIIGTLTDKKPQLRATAVESLDAWREKIGFPAFLENEILSTALKISNPTLRAELLKWIEKSIPNDKKLPVEINESIPTLFACLEDRDADVRKNAQAVVPLIMAHSGYENMAKMANKLDQTSKNAIIAILEKAREVCVPIKKPVKSGGKGGSKPMAKASSDAMSAAAAAMDGLKDAPKEQRKSEEPKKADKGKTASSKKQAPPAASKKNKKGQDEDDGPPLVHVIGKQQRIKDEKNLKVLKWNFGTPRDEIVQQLKEQMAPCVSSSLLTQLFHSDFKFHNQALATLIQAASRPKGGGDPPYKDALIESCDLLLKWVTLRFFDTNTSVLLKTLEFLDIFFQLITEADYKLLDFEASAFIPYLVLKIGDPKDNVRKSVHKLFRHLTNFYPASKVFACVMDGLQSKNSKTRMECLEEIGFLVAKFGMNVCQPSAPKALKEVAGQIGDRDNGVRSAALNALVAAYNIEGEKIYKLVGRLPDKDKSLLDERIKRAGKGRPETGPTIVKPVPNVRKSIDPKRGEAPGIQRSSSDLVGSRLKPRGAPDSSPEAPKGEFCLDFEQIEGGGGVLQGSMPQLIKVDDVAGEESGMTNKRISGGVGKSTYATSAIRDIADVLDYAISQIASSDIQKSMEALVQLEEVFKERKEEVEMAKKVDQYIVTCFVQFKLLFTVHLEYIDTHSDDIHRLLRLLISGLKELFSNPTLATAASKNAIKDTVSYFLSCLAEDRFKKFEDSSVVVRAVNITLLKLIQNTDPTNSLGACIRLLQDCVESGKNIELVQKCIWKIIRLLPESIDRVKVEAVLADVDSLLKSCPESYWQEKHRTSDLNPIRTAKTLLVTFCKLLGFQMLEKLSAFDGQEGNYIVQYVKGHLKTSGVSSKTLTKRGDANTITKDQRRKENTDTIMALTGVDTPKKKQAVVGEIFKKVGSKDNTKEGLNELYEFRQMYPDEDLEPYLRNTSQFFQNYIERGLKSIELERKGHPERTSALTSKPSKDNGDTSGDSESANYLQRLQMLKDKYAEAKAKEENGMQSSSGDGADGTEPSLPKMPEVIATVEEPAKPKRMDEIEEIKRRLQQIKTGNLS